MRKAVEDRRSGAPIEGLNHPVTHGAGEIRKIVVLMSPGDRKKRLLGGDGSLSPPPRLLQERAIAE
jgi:hypothetical protein